ncbi:MAG: neutral zinc metallopeptidase [Gammaproteobacteria bacterium]|uniref:KPN_02809 family neutral zinc metallopeptidase n=1 Tax=Hydrogenophaga sp. TaxID=1904254 RepID=UPI0025BBB852|nr:neutral zinc metallopeptidase [Hydrogenophaga sp.]MBU4181758.1 neutral zinc metallopeptidase [Gammaproteobacteria bacterium]MBU4279294.1 neutral zinc metallopeptidase [Gammaproteobacteria bacterium]MBU4322124.1 neutral zinc metallopeptidase [Gammaproteobacteria bacterium]MBU4508034.1 neutral zinc metallopeptidase [Gammaproteobacteria bacterium]MCG2654166.1 neutral zinc metallopeptidase [Hydrogenophaga sp.]
MKWGNNRQSDQVEDRRSSPGGGMFGGGGRRTGGRNIGLGTIVIALIGGWIFGINPMTILSFLGGAGDLAPSQTQNAPASAPAGKPTDEMGQFVAAVLGGTEDVWMAVFQQSGSQYQKPRLVLFRGAVPTACGTGQSAMGPFYCPGDQKVYIDLSFYETLRSQLGAPGDFAQAYVIAHEVGHHVQNLMGLTQQMEQSRQRVSEREYNALSVRLELQADCFAGIWAHHNHKTNAILEPGDVEEALNAAAAIGDDAIQRKSQGQVVPDSFTHGTSEQRQRWFHKGLETGSVKACDTFNARQI